MASPGPMPPLAPLALQRWAVVEAILGRIRPRRVLEVGCGLGGFGARLAGRYDYVGIEADAESRRAARARVEPLGGLVVDAWADLPPGPFDVVCAFEVLEHMADDAAAMREWAARLAVGGWLLCSVPAGPDRFGSWDAHVGHHRRYRSSRLGELLRECGLTDVEVTHYGWPLGYLTESVRNRLARGAGGGGGSPAQRTAASGRRLQPGRILGSVAAVATAPFLPVQRLRPDRGVGLVALGRRAS